MTIGLRRPPAGRCRTAATSAPLIFRRLLPFISLIEIERPGERYRVRLAGTRLREVHDCETTGLYLDELDWGDKRDYWLAAYHRIAERRKARARGCPGPSNPEGASRPVLAQASAWRSG